MPSLLQEEWENLTNKERFLVLLVSFLTAFIFTDDLICYFVNKKDVE